MKRLLLSDLLEWKSKQSRKPVLLDGARQTGKTHLLSEIFAEEFDNVVRLDFLADPHLSVIFDKSLNPDDILEAIELTLNVEIDVSNTLIIFDEIGENQDAVNSLKFFAEQKPEMFLCASSSNIGLLTSFPVGKVHQLELYPLTFEEFLIASNEKSLLKAFQNMNLGKPAHLRLFDLLKQYYFVGGLPEAVRTWFDLKGDSINQRISAVERIHGELISGYERDFGKYSGKVPATHIAQVFRNVPKQLSNNIDDSVNRYRFKDVIENKNRYLQLSGPISWLEKCKLVSKCHPIESQPQSPLLPLAKDNVFKLFLFDVGLLGRMLNISYQEQMMQDFAFKGYIAENFVQNEIIAANGSPTYSWETKTCEVEFVLKDKTTGNIYPLEVKSGKRTKAKSLKSYCDKFTPEKTIKLIGSQGSLDDRTKIVLPLYYASRVFEVMEGE
jgi:predicted AAA+ superfamily ATPase